MSEYILEMKHITKRFASVVANEDVNLSEKGEVHALLGEKRSRKINPYELSVRYVRQL